MSEIDQHSPGAKLDSGKQLPFTVLGGFAPALKEVTKIGTFGAVKYTKHGWKSVENGKERYYEAMIRHLLEDMENPGSLDEESAMPHIHHAAWNILALITLRLTTPSPSSKIKELGKMTPINQNLLEALENSGFKHPYYPI